MKQDAKYYEELFDKAAEKFHVESFDEVIKTAMIIKTVKSLLVYTKVLEEQIESLNMLDKQSQEHIQELKEMIEVDLILASGKKH